MDPIQRCYKGDSLKKLYKCMTEKEDDSNSEELNEEEARNPQNVIS
jgi:hypothetical protein